MEAVFIRSFLQVPVGVDNKFREKWVESCFVPKLAQSVHEGSVPLCEVQLIAFVHVTRHWVCANLTQKKYVIS